MLQNLAYEHEKIAREIAKVISRHKEVIGITLLGGAARGFSDKNSDIDLSIFTSRKDFKSVKKGEQLWKGYEFDITLVYYEFARQHDWTMDQRWAYSKSKILFDPFGKVKHLLKKKIKLFEREKKIILCLNLMYLAWYGIFYKKGEWRGYRFFGKRSPDFWVQRGDLKSAHYILNICIDMLFDILFAYNKQLIPDEKWKLHLIHSLFWLPHNFEERVKEALLIKALTLEDFKRRLAILQSFLKEIVKQLEKDEVLPEDIYSYLIHNRAIYSTV